MFLSALGFNCSSHWRCFGHSLAPWRPVLADDKLAVAGRQTCPYGNCVHNE